MSKVVDWFRRRKHAPSTKAESELAYWQDRRKSEGTLSHAHFERYYTSHFDLSRDDYTRKRVLDIGCGPRGSLEWASMTSERVGLDPLAESYRELGIDAHQMRYVASAAEQMPFPDDYFDFVCSFNSLDHVDDLDETCAEIVRVLRRGGYFLLLSDLHEEPTPCEPVVYSWDVVDRFRPALELLQERRYEKVEAVLYQSLDAGVPFDPANAAKRYGVLSAKFRKRAEKS